MSHRRGAMLETALALRELARTSVLFRVRGRRAVSEAARRGMQRSPTVEADAPSGWDVWRSVRALNRAEALWPLPVLCLQRSLVLQALLDRHQVPSQLHIGSRLEDGTLEAHAWVESGPHVFDAGTGGFLPFAPPPFNDAAAAPPAPPDENRNHRPGAP